jgi:hypothetical protein
MKDLGQQGHSAGGVAALPSAAEIEAFTARLAAGSGAALSDAERVDFLRAAEVLKCALEGAQAQLAVEFEASQRAEQARAGVRAERQSRGIALQVGLARRASHHRGARLLKLARRLQELPATRAAFRAGLISEFKASLIARQTECLTPEARAKVDLAIAGDPEWLESLGERQLEAEVAKLVYRFDPRAYVERAAKAVEDRRVTSRPAPHTMVWLTALLPVVPGVAVHAALLNWAKAQQAGGDSRAINQLMADRLVELVTGKAQADDLPIRVDLQLADTTALGVDDEPAWVGGYGPIPAQVARDLALRGATAGLATLRRLYTHPGTGRVVGLESTSRAFPQALTELIRLRDQGICRNRWCGAPIRDTDHVQAHSDGGETTFANGQGLCEACNIAKEAPGWSARPRPAPDGLPDHHIVETTTPTGHVYTSIAPQVGVVRRPISMEIYLSEDYATAS